MSGLQSLGSKVSCSLSQSSRKLQGANYFAMLKITSYLAQGDAFTVSALCFLPEKFDNIGHSLRTGEV